MTTYKVPPFSMKRDQLAQFLKTHEQIRQFENLFSSVAEIYPSYISPTKHAALRQLIHLADEGGPFEAFTSGAYMETTPAGSPFPTKAVWYTDATKAAKIVEQEVAYNANKTIATSTWRVYDTDGSTVLATAIDTITYSGVFETSRSRAIA